jgi:hypothetical protein
MNFIFRLDSHSQDISLCICKYSKIKKEKSSQVLLAHTCNPSYSEGRDQENHGSKPGWANSSRDPISKIPYTKQG